VNVHERKKKAVEEAMREHVTAIERIYDTTKAEGNRALENDEAHDVASHVKALEDLKVEKADAEESIKTLQHVEDIGRQLGPAISVGDEPHDRMFRAIGEAMPINKSIGEVFVQSAGYKSLVDTYKSTGRLPSGATTGMVALETKGTLAELPGSGGGAMIPVPQVVPGVVEKLFQPLTLESLLMSGQASSNALRYVVEGTATSGAAGVAEAGTKPESTAGFTTTDEPIKKVATVLPVSEEMLEDAPAVQSYINGRLSLFVQIEAERQLFRGVSGGNEVQGFFTSRGVPIYAGGTAAGNYAEQLFKAINGVRGSAFVEPDWVVMHPTDWQVLRLLKDTANQFYGGGPFLGPYGGPQGPVQSSGQIAGIQDVVWNKAVYVTASIGGAGTALVGTQSAAQVWSRGGLSVEATNSHLGYFTLNLVAIRAERRLGLAVYRPGAFCEVRLA